MENADLIQKIAGGDEQAFRALVSLFQKKVFNIALSFLRNREEAEDISQEVFVEVFRSAGKFKGESAVGTWLYRITVNRSLDFLRSRKSAKRSGITQSIFKQDSVELQFDKGHSDHPGIAMENAERSQILFSMIDKLPERQRAAFILHKVDGLSLKETSEALEISAGAVESLISRSNQTLRKLLSGYYDENYRRK